MIKINEIEVLLNLPYKGEMTIRDIPQVNFIELSNYFGSQIKESVFFDTTTFRRGEMVITLNGEIKKL